MHWHRLILIIATLILISDAQEPGNSAPVDSPVSPPETTIKSIVMAPWTPEARDLASGLAPAIALVVIIAMVITIEILLERRRRMRNQFQL